MPDMATMAWGLQRFGFNLTLTLTVTTFGTASDHKSNQPFQKRNLCGHNNTS